MQLWKYLEGFYVETGYTSIAANIRPTAMSHVRDTFAERYMVNLHIRWK